MAQSRQSTSGIVVSAGFLPGTEVTMETSKPEEVFLTSLTCWRINVLLVGEGGRKATRKKKFFSCPKSSSQQPKMSAHDTLLMLLLKNKVSKHSTIKFPEKIKMFSKASKHKEVVLVLTELNSTTRFLIFYILASLIHE